MTIRLALIYGGASSEHSVSCSTAAGVYRAIDKEKYEVIPIGITRSGKFVLEPIPESVSLDAWPEVSEESPELLFPIGGGELRMAATGISLGKIDIAFPVLHGVNGEDGSIQGLLQLARIPYVGNGILASALAMDKAMAKQVFRQAKIPVAKDITVTREQWLADAEQILDSAKKLSSDALFVKPASSGSSVGVSKVLQSAIAKDPRALSDAVNLAFEHDNTVLIEEQMVGRELECSVLQRASGEIVVSLPGEIVVHGRDFYDYEAKYLGGAAELLVPCELGEKDYREMKRFALAAFEALGCHGLARTDFFLTKKGLVLTEVNTMPGFTPISMYPSLLAASGISYPELVEELIQQGLSKGSSPR